MVGSNQTSLYSVFQHPSWPLRPYLGGLGHSTWPWWTWTTLLRSDRWHLGFGFPLLRTWGSSSISPWMVSQTRRWFQLIPLHRLHSALHYAPDMLRSSHLRKMKSCGRVMFNFVQYLWLSHFDWTHGFVIASPADSSFMSFGLLLFWLNFRIMTKRDSVVANLPSPRDLRMAFAQDLDTPMESVSGYSATAPSSYTIIWRHFLLSTSTHYNRFRTSTSWIPPTHRPHFYFQGLCVRPQSSWTSCRRTWWHGVHEDQNTWNIIPWHCWSCSWSAWSTCRWMGPNRHFGQLLATILQHDRKHVAIPWLWRLPAGQPPTVHRSFCRGTCSISSTSAEYATLAFAAWHSSSRPGRQFVDFGDFECGIIIVIGIFEPRQPGPLSWTPGNPVPLSGSPWYREYRNAWGLWLVGWFGLITSLVARHLDPVVIRFGAIFEKSPAAAGRVCETS